MSRLFRFCAVIVLSADLSCSTTALSHESGFGGQERFQAPASALGGAAPPGAVQLGERLFFDPVLSGSGQTSCATCHDPRHGFAIPERTATFDGGRIGPRNSPSLLTARFFPRLMLDGRFGSLEDQVRGPLTANGEMGSSVEGAARRLAQDPAYVHQFQSVFGEPPTATTLASALAAFERTLDTGLSRFDRYLRGEHRALSPFELEGLEVFTGKGHCSACHRLPDSWERYAFLTDFGYHNLGIGFENGRFADKGLGAVSGRKADQGSFRTPSLRNIALTAPYMHDGSIDTLPDVVEFYDAGGQPNPYLSPFIRPLGLSPREKAALVAFLESLTGENHPGHFLVRGEQ